MNRAGGARLVAVWTLAALPIAVAAAISLAVHPRNDSQSGGAASLAPLAIAPSSSSSQVAAPSSKVSPPGAFGHDWPSALPSQPLPADTDPDICGAWSDLSTAAMQQAQAQHGTVQGCLKVGQSWVLLTQASLGPGEVGVLQCATSDTDCLDGTRPKAPRSFTWYATSDKRSLSLVGQEGDTLIFADPTGQIAFDVDSDSFVPALEQPGGGASVGTTVVGGGS